MENKKFKRNIIYKKNNTGFTLIEIIISISILSVALIATLSLFPKGLQLGRESKETSVATSLAQEKIEEIIAMSYDEIPTGIVEDRSPVETDPQSQFSIYEREALADFVDSDLNVSATDTEFKKIIVTVYWSVGTREKTVQLIRLLNKQ